MEGQSGSTGHRARTDPRAIEPVQHSWPEVTPCDAAVSGVSPRHASFIRHRGAARWRDDAGRWNAPWCGAAHGCVCIGPHRPPWHVTALGPDQSKSAEGGLASPLHRFNQSLPGVVKPIHGTHPDQPFETESKEKIWPVNARDHGVQRLECYQQGCR